MSTAVVQKPKEQRLEAAIDKAACAGIEISAKNGMVITSMAQAMEFAKLLSLSREGVPKHLRENPGTCLLIAIQAYEWQINPIALANKSYVVNDRLCYEASLYQSVVARRAPIVGRVKCEYAGEGPTRTCRVFAELSDGTGIVEYTSPKFMTINPKNSPLWKNDPDQQLFYFSVRSFARRHFPDVMMGIYTVDEMLDSTVETVRAVDSRPKSERLAERLIGSSDTTIETPEFVTTEPERTEAEPAHTSLYVSLSRRIQLCNDQRTFEALDAEIHAAVTDGQLTSDDGAELLAELAKVGG